MDTQKGIDKKTIRKILVFTVFLSTIPFLIPLKDLDFNSWLQIKIYFGSVLGFIGGIFLLWQVFFGLNIVTLSFSKDLGWFNQFHQNLGKYGSLLIFFHPALKLFAYADSILGALLIDFSDPTWINNVYGRLALFFLIILWFTSVFLRRKLGFKLWKYLHYLSYPLLFFVFLHAFPIGTFLNRYGYLKNLWDAYSVIFYAIVLYRIYFIVAGKRRVVNTIN